MCVLASSALRERLPEIVTPYDPACVQPASYDIHLGHAPPRRPVGGRELPWALYDSNLVLATTLERVSIPLDLTCALEGVSTLARRGLIIHATAGWVDPGFRGEITLELSLLPGCGALSLKPGMRIGQLVFYTLHGTADPYSGRYQNQEGPTLAR